MESQKALKQFKQLNKGVKEVEKFYKQYSKNGDFNMTMRG